MEVHANFNYKLSIINMQTLFAPITLGGHQWFQHYKMQCHENCQTRQSVWKLFSFFWWLLTFQTWTHWINFKKFPATNWRHKIHTRYQGCHLKVNTHAARFAFFYLLLYFSTTATGCFWDARPKLNDCRTISLTISWWIFFNFSLKS